MKNRKKNQVFKMLSQYDLQCLRNQIRLNKYYYFVNLQFDVSTTTRAVVKTKHNVMIQTDVSIRTCRETLRKENSEKW